MTGDRAARRQLRAERRSDRGGRPAPVSREIAAAIAAASRPIGCPSCGMTFGSPSAHTVAHDQGRCLPPSAYGQLVDVSGVWCIRGSDLARQ